APDGRKYRLKFVWLAAAIFAPELGILTAYKQYQRSKSLAADLSRLRAEAAEKSVGAMRPDAQGNNDQDSIRRNDDAYDGRPSNSPFSHTYGFYGLMGGLAVNVSHLHDRLDKVLLTPSGLIYLAEKGYFFEIADLDIQDKSKASWLAKGFVLLQITWTFLQCLSRKAVGLPLSVLEVHVLVHAGCALIMYVLWFNKPMDIDEPTDVSPKIPEKIIALMLVQNHYFGTQPYRDLELPIEWCPIRLAGKKSSVWPRRGISEAAYLMYNPQPSSDVSGCNLRNEPQVSVPESQPVNASLQTSLTQGSGSVLDSQTFQVNGGTRPIQQSAVSEEDFPTFQARLNTSEPSLSSTLQSLSPMTELRLDRILPPRPNVHPIPVSHAMDSLVNLDPG
ncbi:MAG: hypothetical protein Q9224_006866, partial [Gallowayella concinna]